MRVRVTCDGSTGSRRFLVRVPQDLELVADLVRHVQMRLPEKVESLVLRVGGFALLPTLRLTDVVRDDDEVTVSTAGSEHGSTVLALPAPLGPPEKRQRLPGQGLQAAKLSQADAQAAQKERVLPPFPQPSMANGADAKKPKEAAAKAPKARKETRETKAGPGTSVILRII